MSTPGGGWGVEDHPGVLGADPVGASVVDEVAEPVWGQPDVAALSALSGAVAGVGLVAVMSSPEGAGVVGAGLAGWTAPDVLIGVECDRVVVVEVPGGGGGVGPVVAAGGQVDAFLEGLGVLVGGGADPVGQVQDRFHGQVGAGQQCLEPGQGDRAEALDPGHRGGAVDRGLVQVDVQGRLRGQPGQVRGLEGVEQIGRERRRPAGLDVDLLLRVPVFEQQLEQFGGAGQPPERDRPDSRVASGCRGDDLRDPGQGGLDPDRVPGLDPGDHGAQPELVGPRRGHVPATAFGLDPLLV